MALIKKMRIRNFRCIKELVWCPNPGLNCLVGHGDIGKSTILDAIDVCLTSRRIVHFTDKDFHNLDIRQPIEITMVIGDLPDECKNFEKYGNYLRGYDSKTQTLQEEPSKDTDTVLSLQLTVTEDLEPLWSLLSQRGKDEGSSRTLAWQDRMLLAPLRIGALNNYHFGWQRGSILNRLSDEKPDTAPLLLKLSRDARESFGTCSDEMLNGALEKITETAKELGIPIGDYATAMLDIGAISLGDGALSLHDSSNIPMRNLGTGSSRLLLAGLHRKAVQHSTILLIDELEYGLEPHRIISLLKSLGSKESPPTKQVFMTTHSPVVIRELTGTQLAVIVSDSAQHTVQVPGEGDSTQGTLRKYPEAFLAPRIIVCEGPSEVGFIRGLDEYKCSQEDNYNNLMAKGVALVDGMGGTVEQLYSRAKEFSKLGYQILVFRDDDTKLNASAIALENELLQANVKIIKWRSGYALEDELFASLPDDAISRLLDYANDLYGFDLICEHVKSSSDGQLDLGKITPPLPLEKEGTLRAFLAKAAKKGKRPWYKSQTKMEQVALIVGPYISDSDENFQGVISALFDWINGRA